MSEPRITRRRGEDGGVSQLRLSLISVLEMVNITMEEVEL